MTKWALRFADCLVGQLLGATDQYSVEGVETTVLGGSSKLNLKKSVDRSILLADY
jgi:hypothetical protein